MLAVVLSLGTMGWAGQDVLGAVKPHSLFTDGMVLQQGMKVPIWGTADDGEKVTVTFEGQEVSTTAKDGKWKVQLKDLKAGGPFTLTISGTNTIKLKNVLVGEVWVCGGQSNMQWSMKQIGATKDIENSENAQIRLFSVHRGGAPTPQTELDSKKGKLEWVECGPKTVPSFSAVGYYFGRDLEKARKVPIGLINSNYGGTPAERWTTRKTLDADPDLKALKGSDLYNAMIAPLQPFAIRGVIWYQGESNDDRAEQYKKLFPAMIKDWRDGWKQGDFPFLFVQLAPYDKVKREGMWAELREAQLYAWQKVPNTAMVVITDVGDPKDIHPKQKEPVGARLALAARALAYREKIVYSGPIYDGMKIDGNKIILSFKHVGAGLVAKGGPLQGFTIAGKDQKFVKAQATIVDGTVVVHSPEVPEPVAVRYGWANYPIVNLWNKDGLPASPFRTDNLVAPAGVKAVID
jgi:sialate O-acetylesterase